MRNIITHLNRSSVIMTILSLLIFLSWSSFSAHPSPESIENLLLSRFNLCGEIVEIKRQKGLAIFDEQQEKKVLINAIKSAKTFQFNETDVVRFISSIMNSCKKIEHFHLSNPPQKTSSKKTLLEIRHQLANINLLIFQKIDKQMGRKQNIFISNATKKKLNQLGLADNDIDALFTLINQIKKQTP